LATVELRRFRGSKAGQGTSAFALLAGIGATPAAPPGTFVSVATTVGLTRPQTSIIVAETGYDPAAKSSFSPGTDQTIDARDCAATNHASGATAGSPFKLASPGAGAALYGAEATGQQALDVPWVTVRSDWSDDGGLECTSPSGDYYFEAFRLEKQVDAIEVASASTVVNQVCNIRHGYIKNNVDAAIANDGQKKIDVSDLLVDGTFTFLSQKPASTDPAVYGTTIVTPIKNCLIRLRRTAYTTQEGGAAASANVKFTGPWNSSSDTGLPVTGGGTALGYVCGWLFDFRKEAVANPRSSLRVDMKDCLVVCESLGQVAMQWPPGTYSNVKVLYVGPGTWPGDPAPPGVTIVETQSTSEWSSVRVDWLTKHNGDTSGNDFTYLHSVEASTIGLPTWPVKYTGNTYYVTASGGGTSISTDPANPGTAQDALDHCNSLSTIVFLGAGPYGSLTLNRSTTVHLKLKSNVAVLQGLQNLSPKTLTVGDLAGLADTVVIGKQLNTSARLNGLTIQQGGNIWIEGFRTEFPTRMTVGGATTSNRVVAGVWFEKCRWWQGDGVNVQVGPMTNNNTVNQLNVFHNCWSESVNEIGDPKAGGGTWTSDAGAGSTGTAICDYGINCYQGIGAVIVIECFFQMRANHMISFKRGVGEVTGGGNRIEGNLFTSWNRTDYHAKNTHMELGQEYDQPNQDYTSLPVSVKNNTHCDNNGLIWYLKNQDSAVIDGNRIILCSTVLMTSLDGGVTTNDGVSNGPIHPGPFTVSNNVILDKGGTVHLYSVGVATSMTFDNNDTPSLIPVVTHATVLQPENFANGQSSFPRMTVNLTGGNASGFGPVSNA
jgi:hypothetical protein